MIRFIKRIKIYIIYTEKKLLDFTRSRSTCHLFVFGHEMLNLHFMIVEYFATCNLWSQKPLTSYHLAEETPRCRGHDYQWLGDLRGGGWRCYCDEQWDMHVTVVSQYDMWRTSDKIYRKHHLRQGQTERFSSLLNYSYRAQLNWWSDLNNKRQIIKNIWKIFIDLTSSFLAAHSFSTYQPDQLYP